LIQYKKNLSQVQVISYYESNKKVSSELLFWLLCRMDEMMHGQRGWRELAVLGDKVKGFNGMIEGLIRSPRSNHNNDQSDDWAFEKVGMICEEYFDVYFLVSFDILSFFLLALCNLIFLYCKQGPHSDFDGPTSGSTACVAIIRNNLLFVANAGDSRCVISRNGQVTSEQKFLKF